MTREELDALIANPPPPYKHRIIPSEKGDHVNDECGVFAVYGDEEAAKLIYLGLYALQHRGQEGAGIVCTHNGELTAHRGVGLVSDVFKPHKLARVKGNIGIGHVRYSTFGSSSLRNVAPLVADYARGSVAVAHNGNLVNASRMREQLEEMGAIFQSTTDSEVIIHRISRSPHEDFTDSVIDSLRELMGAYSVVIMNGDEIVAARDPLGFRPLWLGKLDDAYIVASETCALDIIDADYIREIEPGEVVTINKSGVHSQKPFAPVIPKQCIFEFIYISRPDSDIFGRPVDEVRKAFGAALAEQAPVEADVVMAVPDSSNPAALGYSHASGIPFDMGIIRNHYVGRTFIEPEQGIRDFGVKIKLNPSRSAIEGKRIVLVDDSVVRGTTARKIIKMLRRNGAAEIHFRVSSPQIINSCHYGIDTANPSKLIAHNMSVDEIRDFLGVDSLSYLTIPNMVNATGCDPSHFCLGCFTSQYPTPTPHDFLPSRHNHRHIDHSMEVYAQ